MPNPFVEALQKLASRTTVGAGLSSADWGAVPIGLRERAFFSARVTAASYVQEIKDRVESILKPETVQRAQPEQMKLVTEGLNLASARTELKELLRKMNYSPAEDKRGTIEDLSSDQRLNLQLKHNVESAQGYGDFLQGQAPGALDAYPAQELFRAEERQEPRNWIERWRGAGGRFYDGDRMIALKSDPIWTEISAFGTPYPPFDFNSGMWVRDVSRTESERLGVLQPGEPVESSVPNFNESLEASVKNLDPEMQRGLKESFGDQITIEEGIAKWVEKQPTPPPPPPVVKPPAPINPTPKEIPDLTDLAKRYEPIAGIPTTQAAKTRRALIEEARDRLTVPDPGTVRLAPVTMDEGTREVARDGAKIVERYVSAELLSKTKTVYVQKRDGREFCDWDGTINISGATSSSTAAHEIVHAIEFKNPDVLAASAKFLLQRGVGETPKKLRDITGNPGYDSWEIALEDDWQKRNGSPYAGKVYTKIPGKPLKEEAIKATEVLTMGIERLHADPLEFHKNDKEWFEFTVRALRGIL